jgi:transcriptional regulator with XRE-family HTH domain
MSEKELAERIGVKRPYINALSSGKKNATITQLERIAETLGMTLHICFEEIRTD